VEEGGGGSCSGGLSARRCGGASFHRWETTTHLAPTVLHVDDDNPGQSRQRHSLRQHSFGPHGGWDRGRLFPVIPRAGRTNNKHSGPDMRIWGRKRGGTEDGGPLSKYSVYERILRGVMHRLLESVAAPMRKAALHVRERRPLEIALYLAKWRQETPPRSANAGKTRGDRVTARRTPPISENPLL
jgi:hypothetical protein